MGGERAALADPQESRFRTGDRPSRTAEYMALFRAVETSRPARERLFDDPYAASLLTGRLKVLAAIAHLPWIGICATWLLDFGWPRTRSSAVIRTRVIDDLVRHAAATGAAQALFLGAGFDSRPYRLLELRRAAIFEVDHPATQAAKRARLLPAFREFPKNVRFVAVDFEKDSLEEALLSAGFDSRAVTVVIWEGVVSYLTAATVDRNFRLLARILAPGSLLIFTYVHRGALDGSVVFAEAQRWKSSVGSAGEPFIFGFDPAELPNYLEQRGFSLVSDASTADSATGLCDPQKRSEPGSQLYRAAAAQRSAYNDSYV